LVAAYARPRGNALVVPHKSTFGLAGTHPGSGTGPGERRVRMFLSILYVLSVSKCGFRSVIADHPCCGSPRSRPVSSAGPVIAADPDILGDRPGGREIGAGGLGPWPPEKSPSADEISLRVHRLCDRERDLDPQFVPLVLSVVEDRSARLADHNDGVPLGPGRAGEPRTSGYRDLAIGPGRGCLLLLRAGLGVAQPLQPPLALPGTFRTGVADEGMAGGGAGP
jgi:hypothetical protein